MAQIAQMEEDDECQIPLQVEEFCVGPVAAQQFWHGERLRVELDCGPWITPEKCLISAARREIDCSLDHAKPRPRQTFLLPTSHSIDPSEHISFLSKYLRLAPHLVSKNLSAPTLRHPDLSLANIYLVPGSTEIASIIDWQGAMIFPLFMQAGYPKFCEHDSSRTQSLQIPTLPETFDNMTRDEQLKEKTKFRLEEANLYYTAATGVHNDKHIEALKLPYGAMRQYLHQQTGYQWDTDLIDLRMALVGITSAATWPDISSSSCPAPFSDDERTKAIADSQVWE